MIPRVEPMLSSAFVAYARDLRHDPNVGIVNVPDARLYELQKIVKTNVVIPAPCPTRPDLSA